MPKVKDHGKAPPPSVQDITELQVQPVEPVEVVSTLPPHIITNPREKIEPEHFDQMELFHCRRTEFETAAFNALIFADHRQQKEPIPKHPIFLSWWPIELCFRLGQIPVTRRLSICNRSPKIMYIHCCGLWDDRAQLGASWRCFPRTRILLAPGLRASIFIRAKPRDESPVPYALAGLQLATAHCKDTVFGYFVVPIVVSFQNYTAPPVEFEGEYDDEH